MLYPKTTLVIEDLTGTDIKPRIVDNVPLSLAVFANITSRIGIGTTQLLETVFHMPNDFEYSHTGMLMGAKLVLAAKNFEITDSQFNANLNEFMQQCVFYDLLLNKYSLDDLVHTNAPWEFIRSNTSVARAFPLNGEIKICREGASILNRQWKNIINNAAQIYGGQIFSGTHPKEVLLSRLSDGYSFLTHVSADGAQILQTNLLANAMSNALRHYAANNNAPAALLAYEDTKASLQSRETMNETGRQAGQWMQHFKNIIEAVLYASFILIYFLSYFPFGASIVRNYLLGMFVIQALSPMYAIIHFAGSLLAENRCTAFITNNEGLSLFNLAGITQANADAIAVAGYLIWPVTLGGAIMLYRGLPGAIQSMGQFIGGVVQHTGSHVAGEVVGGNISAGNANFANQSLFNSNANHLDKNFRFAEGGINMQTGTGSSLTYTPEGGSVLNTQGALSNLSTHINVSESIRAMASSQSQSSLNSAYSLSQSAGESYSSAIRQLDDYAHSQAHTRGSGDNFSTTDSAGKTTSAHTVSQLINAFDENHHVGHERAAQILGQAYVDIKLGESSGLIKARAGANGSISYSGRSSYGSLHSEAERFAIDNNFVEAVDHAKREIKESHYRDGNEVSARLANSISSSFDHGDSLRNDASSQYSRAENYAKLASTVTENAASINTNYSQAFKGWLEHQDSPSPLYGEGKLNESAIDKMAVHEPALLQGYADRYMQEKSGEALRQFENSHHLSHPEAAIERNYQQNSSHIPTVKQITHDYEDGKSQVMSSSSLPQNSNESIKKVDSSKQAEVNQAINDRLEDISKKKNKLEVDRNNLATNVDEKIKGQVIGSLNVVKKAENIVKNLVKDE